MSVILRVYFHSPAVIIGVPEIPRSHGGLGILKLHQGPLRWGAAHSPKPGNTPSVTC